MKKLLLTTALIAGIAGSANAAPLNPSSGAIGVPAGNGVYLTFSWCWASEGKYHAVVSNIQQAELWATDPAIVRSLGDACLAGWGACNVFADKTFVCGTAPLQ